jgi:hypothetical protein
MDHPDMTDALVRIQHGHNFFNRWNRAVALVDFQIGPADALQDLRCPVAIGAVGNDQGFPPLVRAQAAQRCFNGKSADPA